MISVRPFAASDTASLLKLFYHTVHEVCTQDYSVDQLNSWAPVNIDEAQFGARLAAATTLVAMKQNIIIGFCSLETTGNVDMFYVHAHHQKENVGSILFNELESQARLRGMTKLTSDVSLTARPFFLRQGFKVTREYSKVVRGSVFKKTWMEKELR